MVSRIFKVGAAGVIVTPDDHAALADALTRTLEDGALAARLMDAGSRQIADLRPEPAIHAFGQLLEELTPRGRAVVAAGSGAV